VILKLMETALFEAFQPILFNMAEFTLIFNDKRVKSCALAAPNRPRAPRL